MDIIIGERSHTVGVKNNNEWNKRWTAACLFFVLFMTRPCQRRFFDFRKRCAKKYCVFSIFIYLKRKKKSSKINCTLTSGPLESSHHLIEPYIPSIYKNYAGRGRQTSVDFLQQFFLSLFQKKKKIQNERHVPHNPTGPSYVITLHMNKGKALSPYGRKPT